MIGTALIIEHSLQCLCVAGFGGKNCQEDVDECAKNPCQNGATCKDYVNSFTCTCRSGFSGRFCETNDNDCTASSCLNGGTCIDGINSYQVSSFDYLQTCPKFSIVLFAVPLPGGIHWS